MGLCKVFNKKKGDEKVSLEEIKKQIENDSQQMAIAIMTGFMQALCSELIIKEILTPEDVVKITDNASKMSNTIVTSAAVIAYKKIKEDFDDEDFMIQKHLTIREARNEIEKLENELDLYLTKKKINYVKTQPGSSKFKDVVTNRTNEIFDKFSHYIIKDEELDTKIYSLQESILSYQEYILKEMKRISKIEPHKIEVYELREDMEFIRKNKRKRTWLEIAELTGYSDRQVHRFYDEIIKGKI